MKYTEFINLTVVSGGQAQIDTLSAGDKFLFPSQEWQITGVLGDPKAIALRHKVHYQRKTDPIDSYGVTGPAVGYVPEYDILESDVGADETKTATRKGISRNDTRDDDGRNTVGNGIFNETDWV